MTTRTTTFRASGERRGRRVLAVFVVAATLALTGVIISGPQIGAKAAGSTGFPGSAWAWGSNSYGQLGNGIITGSSTPVAVSLPSGTPVTAIAGGGGHSLALTPGCSATVCVGRVLAWGNNGAGQLGNGTTTGSSTPVAVSMPSGFSGMVTAIAAGSAHSLALVSDASFVNGIGQVLAWGDNSVGQLGDGTTTSSTTPVQVYVPSGNIAIAGGDRHSLALSSNGQVWAWGYNGDGELGNGTTTNSRGYVVVSLPNGTTVTAIAGGGSRSSRMPRLAQTVSPNLGSRRRGRMTWSPPASAAGLQLCRGW